MNVIEIDGKNYVKVGDKLVEVDESGKPKGVWSESKENAAGGVNCTVHVPCLQVAAEPHEPT